MVKRKKITVDDKIFEDMIIASELKDEMEKDEPLAELEKPEPIKEENVRVLPTVNVKVFSQISGIKWDQLAAFQHYVKAERIHRLTIPEWHDLYKTFKVKPVK